MTGLPFCGKVMKPRRPFTFKQQAADGTKRKERNIVVKEKKDVE